MDPGGQEASGTGEWRGGMVLGGGVGGTGKAIVTTAPDTRW